MADDEERPTGAGAFVLGRLTALAEVAAVVLVVLSLATALAPLSQIADVLTSFRHLFAIGCLPVLIVLFARRRTRLAVVTLLTLVGNFALVARALPLAKGCEPDLTVLTVNALGKGSNVAKTLAVVNESRADLVIVTELGKRLDAALKRHYMHHVSHASDAQSGVGIFSRLPVQSSNRSNGAWFPQFTVVVPIGGRDVTVVAAHPPPPLVDNSSMFRNMEILGIAKRVRESDTPFIIAGDLNLTRQSPHFQPLLKAGLVDARVGHGVAGTWPARSPFRVGIDHVLHTDHFQTCDLDVGRAIGSDHLPLIARLKTMR